MFQLEKEMIPILKRDLPKIFGSTHIAEEFVSGNGRPDLVFACASSKRSFWKQTPPNYQTLHILVKYLNKEGRVLHIDKILSVDIQNRKKIQAILDTLSKEGYIEYQDKNHLIVRRIYQPIIEEFISIEAKLSDWKSGVYQAVRYKTFSNSSYLAISEESLDRVDRSFLRLNGIGLITVSGSSANIIMYPRKNKPKSIISHYYLSEQLVNSNSEIKNNS